VDILKELDVIEELLADDRLGEAFERLPTLFPALHESSRAVRDVTYRFLTKHAAHPHPTLGARFALAAGALVEQDADPAYLAQKIVPPLKRALDAATRLIAAVERLPPSPTEVEPSDDTLDVSGRTLDAEMVNLLRSADPEAAAAFESLELWYRPAVASWTRAPAILRALQSDTELAAALKAVRDASDGGRWLYLVSKVAFETSFVALLPEIDEGWAFTVDGVSDTGQLSVLLSHALREPLGRIGVAPAPPDVFDVMRGEGPQETSSVYGCKLRMYPWQAIAPATFYPHDGRFTWLAPGGSGDHSLPADFLPAGIAPLRDGVRVLSLVGPEAPGMSLTRELSAARTFAGLRATVTDVRRLSADELARTKSAVIRTVSS